MTRSTILLLLVGWMTVAACTSESPPATDVTPSEPTVVVSPKETPKSPPASKPIRTIEGNRPAQVHWAQVMPDPLVLSGPVSVAVEAVDPEGGPLTLRHQWYVNGRKLEAQTSPSIAAEMLSRGDRVSVVVTPLDAHDAGTPFETSVAVVVNTPPWITEIKIEPFPARVGNRLVPTVESKDPDGDEITYAYRWTHNGDVVYEGEEGELDLAKYVRGDKLLLEITPRDEHDTGETLATKTFSIENSPPEITSTPPTDIKNGLYAYNVTATDRDGDPITYGLATAPPGMVIDSKTGQLTWRLTAENKGTFKVRVTASDGQEDEPGWQEFEMLI